jgi:hypothetical protein
MRIFFEKTPQRFEPMNKDGDVKSLAIIHFTGRLVVFWLARYGAAM